MTPDEERDIERRIAEVDRIERLRRQVPTLDDPWRLLAAAQEDRRVLLALWREARSSAGTPEDGE